MTSYKRGNGNISNHRLELLAHLLRADNNHLSEHTIDCLILTVYLLYSLGGNIEGLSGRVEYCGTGEAPCLGC